MNAADRPRPPKGVFGVAKGGPALLLEHGSVLQVRVVHLASIRPRYGEPWRPGAVVADAAGLHHTCALDRLIALPAPGEVA